MISALASSLRSAGAAVVMAMGLPLAAQAAPLTYDLTFETGGQSIWGTGSSFALDKTAFLGVAWQDKGVSIDAIAGDETTNLPNPLRVGYDAAFAACTLLYSSSVCINGQTAQAFVPALGSRPGVRSCGTFAFACQAARLGDIARRAAYDAAFATCRLGFSASVCRNGQPLKLPVVALGAAPSSYLSVDTRTGFALNGTTDGRVGLELGVKIDSGSVDARVLYQASLEIPDTAGLDKATPINFNPNSSLAGASTLNTSFSNVVMSVDAVMQVSGGVYAEGCFLAQGCVTGGTSFSIDEKAPILTFNADGQGGVELLGTSPSDFGLPAQANGFPFGLDVANLAEITLHLPQPNASGGLEPASGLLKAAGQDDLIDLTLDLDNIVATSVGLPGLFGTSVDIPVLGEIGFDIINVEMGPTIDLKQEFELDPTLFVSFAFDKAVKIGDQIVTEWTSAWDLLPAITFLDDVTRVTPTFFLQADLLNRTLLDFDLEFGIDLLQIYYDFGLLGDGQAGVGNVLSQGVDLFDSPDLFRSMFPLQGWNLQVGEAFEVNFLSGSSAPTSLAVRTALNTIVLPGDVTILIPVPGSLMLLLVGLAAIRVSRRDRRVVPSV